MIPQRTNVRKSWTEYKKWVGVGRGCSPLHSALLVAECSRCPCWEPHQCIIWAILASRGWGTSLFDHAKIRNATLALFFPLRAFHDLVSMGCSGIEPQGIPTLHCIHPPSVGCCRLKQSSFLTMCQRPDKSLWMAGFGPQAGNSCSLSKRSS